MSREIKFRAWDYDTNTMIYPDSELETIFCFDKVGLSVYHNNGQELSSFELMQYAGLKDKNGKEIYEGDILYHNEYYWLVKHGEYKYHTYDSTDITSYGLIFENYNFGETNNFNSNWIVVGNIYENPELLEEEQLCYIMQE